VQHPIRSPLDPGWPGAAAHEPSGRPTLPRRRKHRRIFATATNDPFTPGASLCSRVPLHTPFQSRNHHTVVVAKSVLRDPRRLAAWRRPLSRPVRSRHAPFLPLSRANRADASESAARAIQEQHNGCVLGPAS